MKYAVKLLLTMAVLTGCKQAKPVKSGFESVSVDVFETRIAEKNNQLLDVRTTEEFQNGHIHGAQNLDVMAPDFAVKADSLLIKKQLVLVYCRSGKRSKKAAGILVDKGYQVVELDKGFNGWVSAGKPVE